MKGRKEGRKEGKDKTQDTYMDGVGWVGWGGVG